MNFTFEYVISLITGFLGIILLAFVYTYIDKLEKIGCACAEHPDRKFIKNYTIFAMVFFAIAMFLPPALLTKYIGSVAGTIMMVVKIIFGIASIVFFVKSLMYVRYLMKEKCRCSEDIRREVMYIWSILEIILISTLVIIHAFLAVTSGAFAVARATIKEASKHSVTIADAVINPLNSVKKIPRSLKKGMKTLRMTK